MTTNSGLARVDKEFGKDADSCICLHSGLAVNPLDLQVDDIIPEDIAHNLSNQCRFSGSTRVHYSVAEHCVRVTRWVKEKGGSWEDEQWALLHDAAEAYLQDVARPLKNDPYFGKAYRGAEDRAMKVICERFGLPPKIPAIVSDGDVALFAAERRDLMPYNKIWKMWKAPNSLDVPSAEVKPWTPLKAKNEFLSHFHRLFGPDS